MLNHLEGPYRTHGRGGLRLSCAHIESRTMEQAFDYLDAPVVRVCGADVPMPYARNLEAASLPATEQVIEAAKSVCYT